MFTYDAYKNRIKKIAAVRHFIFRFKVPIIIVLSLIVGLVTTLLCTKGMITTDFGAPDSVTYGDEYEVGGAKAFLSDIEGYEYKLEGEGNWTREKPIYAGKYEVRAVTNGAFGYKYSDAKTFEILPVKARLDILDDSVTYGDDPAHVEIKLEGDDSEANKLVYSDRLSVSSLEYEYAGFASENTTVSVVRDSITILGATGVNVAHCYDISLESAHEIRLNARKMSVTASAQNVIYNGAPQTEYWKVSASTEMQLPSGDRVVFETVVRNSRGEIVANPTDAGDYTVSIDGNTVKVYKGSADVTARYDLTVPDISSSFTIAKRPLNVKIENVSREYDGTPLSSYKFEATGAADGHAVSAITSSLASITDAGSITNLFDVTVSGSNSDVTKNYDISYVAGTLTVLPRKITVESADGEWTYDGTAHFKADFDYAQGSQRLLTGHEFEMLSAASITDAGETDNVINLTVTGQRGNYEIVCIAGKLKVAKRKVSISTNSNTDIWEYAGIAYSLASYEITSEIKIADNQSLEILKYASVIDAGVYDNEILFDVTDVYGRSVLGNYELGVTYGKLTVVKRKISFNTGGGEWIYDGLAHSVTTVTQATHEDGIGFVLNHYARVKNGVSVISVTKFSESGTLNAYSKDDYAIYDGNNIDVSANYEIVSVVAGVLDISKRPVTVASLSDTWVYDGAAHECHDFDYAYGSLSVAEGETFTVLVSTSVTDAESKQNVIISYEIKSADGAGSDDNYSVTVNNAGTVTVTRRPLSVTMNSKTKVYDATPLFDGGFDYDKNMSASGLVSGHAVSHSVEDSALPFIVDFGSAVNNIDKSRFTVKSGNSDVTANYDINVNAGTLTITKRSITFKSRDKSFVYDGNSHNGTEGGIVAGVAYDITAGSLVNGQISVPTKNSSVTDVSEGEVNNELTYVITDANGNRYSEYGNYLTYNYDITALAGKLKVTPRPIRIEIATNESIVYDGEDHTLSAFEYRSDGVNWLDIVDGHTLSINTVVVNEVVFDGKGYGNANVISVANTLKDNDSWDIIGSDKSNYTLEVIAGRLKVLRRQLSVATESAVKEYDGVPLTCTDYSSKNIVTGHAIGVDTTKTIASRTDVGEAENKLEFYIRNAIGKDVIVNYDISYTYGTLTVTPRKLVVKVGSASWEYDGAAHYFDEASFEHYGDGAFGLVSGHTYESASAKIYITNAWESGVEENTYSYKILSGTTDVTRNYEFVGTDSGRLTVTPRAITVTRLGEIKEYDGTPLVGDKYEAARPYGMSGNALVSGAHRLEIVGKATEYTNVGSIWNATEYTVVCDAEERIAQNYRITYMYSGNDGYLTVTARLIRITTPSASKVYDSALLSATEGETVEHIGADLKPDGKAAFVLGHKQQLVESSVSSITHVNQTASGNNTLAYIVVGANGETNTTDNIVINDNYYIMYVYGTLTVTPRPVNVTNESKTKVYDDKYFFLPQNTAAEYPAPAYIEPENDTAKRGLLAGHALHVTESTIVDLRDAGEEQNTVKYTVHDSSTSYNGGDISEDYTINYTLGTLTVNKRPITVKMGSEVWEYDGEEHSTSLIEEFSKTDENSGLVENHFLNGYYAMAKITDVGTIANTTRCQIWNGSDGYKNVSDNYDITFIDGTLQVTPRNIGITVNSFVYEYDGNAHGDASYTAKHLAKNSADEWAEDGGYVFATPYAYKHAAYRVGDLITVTNVSDGIKQNIYSYKIYRAIDDGEAADIWLDELGGWAKDVTSNYNIVDITAGTIEVTPRNVLILRESSSKMYDGTPLNGTEYSAYHYKNGSVDYEGVAFVSESHIAMPIYGSITAITEVKESGALIKTLYQVYEGNVLSQNYEILYADVNAVLSIEPRPITVRTESDEREYNGLPLENHDFFVSGVYGLVYDIANGIYHYARLSEDGAEVAKFGAITDVGDIQNYLSIEIVDSRNILVDISNYDITYVYGTLTVTPRPLYIRPIADSKIYDGLDYKYPDYYGNFEYYKYDGDSDYTVVSGEQLKITELYYKFVSDGVEVISGGPATYAFDYKIYAVAYETADGKSNYKLMFGEDAMSTLIISKRQIAIAGVLENKIYDGVIYDNGGKWEYIGEPNEDNKIVSYYEQLFRVDLEYRDMFGNAVSPIYAGTYSVTITDYHTPRVLQDADGTVTELKNYELAPWSGTFTISQRTVNSVVSYDSSKVYNKASLEGTGYYSDDMIAQDIPFIKASYNFYSAENEYALLDSAPVNAGTYYMRVTSLADADGYGLLANYDFTSAEYPFTEVRISPAPLTVRPVGGSRPYGGEQVTYDDLIALNGGKKYEVVYYTLYEGDELNIKSAVFDNVLASVTDAGVYTVSFTVANDNYDIYYEVNMFEITRLDISVTTAGGTFVYTGEVVNVDTDSTLNISDEVKTVMEKLGHRVQESGGSAINSAVNVGAYKNDRTVKVIDSLGNDVSHNYNITENYGDVIIDPATVTVGIQMQNGIYSRVYNGKPFEITLSDTTADGFVKDHYFDESTSWQEFSDAGVYESFTLYSNKIVDGLGNDVTANYKIEYASRRVEITRLTLYVQPNLDEREFDGTERKIELSEVISNYGDIVESDLARLYFGYTVTQNGEQAPFMYAGEYSVRITEILLGDKSVYSSSSNYELYSTDSAYLTFDASISKYDLNAHNVSVKVNDYVVGYNATVHYGSYATVSAENMLSGYYFKSVYGNGEYKVELPNERVEENKPTGFIICDSQGVDRSGSFTLDKFSEYDYGYMEVTDKAVLKPDWENSKFVYDATVKFDISGGVITGTVNDGITLRFEARATDIEYTDAKGVTVHTDTVFGVGKYKITYSDVKYFVSGNNGLTPLAQNIADMLVISNETSFEFTVVGQAVYVMPDVPALTATYNGVNYIEVSDLAVRAYGARSGDRFVPTAVTDSLGNIYTADAYGKIYVKLSLDKYNYVKFTYVSGKMIAADGSDVSENYEITYLNNTIYKSQKNMLGMYGVPDSLTSSDFAVKITYEKRSLVVRVNRLPDGVESTYKYIGEERILRIDESIYGFVSLVGELYNGSIPGVEKASVTASVGVKSSWFKINVTDGDGNPITKLYDIDYEYDESAYITVTKGDIVVSGNGVSVNGIRLTAIDAPAYEYVDGVFTVTFDGKTVKKDESNLLVPNDGYTYYKLDGATNYIKVDAYGNYVLFKYTATGTARQDNLTSYYNTEAI